MDNLLISVIIPVYNIEKYLARCLDSVLAQSYRDIEVLAVDDGSTDGSGRVLREYEKKDSRVKPIFKENGGVSSARNIALDTAKGEYIYFLDGDDWIEPDTFEKLMRFSKDFDFVQASYVDSFPDGREEVDGNVYLQEKEIFSTKEMIDDFFLARIWESSWNKLYSRAFIGGTRFNENHAVAEDSEFIFELIKRAHAVKLITDATYHYNIREDSCMQSGISEKQFDVLAVREKQYKEISSDAELIADFAPLYAKNLFFLIHEALLDKDGRFKDRIPSLREKAIELRKYVFRSKALKLRFKLGMLLLWLFPGLFYKLYSR